MTPEIFSETRRRWSTLAQSPFSLFTIMLDNPVVNIALPSIQEDLPIGSPSSSGSSPAKPSPSPRSCSPAASSPIRGAG